MKSQIHTTPTIPRFYRVSAEDDGAGASMEEAQRLIRETLEQLVVVNMRSRDGTGALVPDGIPDTDTDAVADVDADADIRRINTITTDPQYTKRFSRIYVDVCRQVPPLQWLRSMQQRPAEKIYFRCKRQVQEIAVCGFAQVYKGQVYDQNLHKNLTNMLLPTSTNMKFIGGTRFDQSFTSIINPLTTATNSNTETDTAAATNTSNVATGVAATSSMIIQENGYHQYNGLSSLPTGGCTPPVSHVTSPRDPASVNGHHDQDRDPIAQPVDSEWADFDGYIFVLPLLEFGVSEASPHPWLALNIDLNDFEMVHRALQLLISLPTNFSQISYPPLLLQSAHTVIEDTTYNHWKQSLSAVMEHFEKNLYRKVVLARRKSFIMEKSVDPFDIIMALDSKFTNTYLFCFQLNQDVAFLGSTPEMLFRKEEGIVHTEAIAGTIKVQDSTNILDDPQLNSEKLLLASVKDKEEQSLVSDFIKDTLTNCGMNVNVSDVEVLKLPHLVHLCTRISASYTQSDFENAADVTHLLLRNLHPTPAVCGLPVVESKNSIRDLESFERGYYSGPFGWFSAQEAEFCVAIRSALVNRKTVYLYAGCGIIAKSESEKEWYEGELKFSTISRVLYKSHAFSSMSLADLPNIVSLWGNCIIEELCRCGVNQFFIAPGSRSSPLTVAVASNISARYTICTDERGAGFMAVGYARGTGKAAAVITSSGTAVANLFPSLIEAYYESLPVVILTADRPSELRDTGSNQTIDQVKMFGSYARWFKDFACPDPKIPIKSVLSDIDYAVSRANGVESNSGPVHLNFMFREPLAPRKEAWDKSCILNLSNWMQSAKPLSAYLNLRSVGSSSRQNQYCSSLIESLVDAHYGMICVGNLSSTEDQVAVMRLANELNWPILPDIASGLRMGSTMKHSACIPYIDQMLLNEDIREDFCRWDFVIQFGARITSKRINSVLGSSDDALKRLAYVIVDETSFRHNDQFMVTTKVNASASSFVSLIFEEKRQKKHKIRPSVLFKYCSMSCSIDQFIDSKLNNMKQISEPYVARSICKLIHPAGLIFVSNSMPIRDLDMFAPQKQLGLNVERNRGASGIDGILSTSIGYAIGRSTRVTLLIGDLALLHDINALSVLSSIGHGKDSCILTLVVVNNNGGGIFSFLPIKEHREFFHPFFDTPHGVNFESIARGFGVQYGSAKEGREFDEIYGRSQLSAHHCFIEVFTNQDENVAIHRQLGRDIAQFSGDQIKRKGRHGSQ